MSNINNVVLLGNLTREIELRFTPKGSAVANMGLALNRVWTDESGQKKEEVTFLDVAVFSKQAENCAKYLKKGSQVAVIGRLRQENWDDKNTGQKRSKITIVADNVQFLGSPAGGEGGAAAAPRAARPAAHSAPAGGSGEPPESDEPPF